MREVSWKWIRALKHDPENQMKLAPKQWKEFIEKGQKGIEPLLPIQGLDARNNYLYYFAETIAPVNLKEGTRELIDTEDGWSIFEDLNLEQLSQVKTEKTVELFKRNLALTRYLKELYKNECQICGFAFKKENGEKYSECHHLIPLGENGSDTLENVIVVCANCHRMLHYAKVEFGELRDNKIVIEINGESQTIKFQPKHFESH